MIVLEREFQAGPAGTFGKLHIFGGETLETLERPWEANAPNVSCIPPGTYDMRPGTFRGLYENWELLDVPGRSAIEVHRGNSVSDTRGCILVGNARGVVEGGDWGIVGSKAALDRLVDSLRGVEREVIRVLEPAWSE